jgi:hypothetical protein
MSSIVNGKRVVANGVANSGAEMVESNIRHPFLTWVVVINPSVGKDALFLQPQNVNQQD